MRPGESFLQALVSVVLVAGLRVAQPELDLPTNHTRTHFARPGESSPRLQFSFGCADSRVAQPVLNCTPITHETLSRSPNPGFPRGPTPREGGSVHLHVVVVRRGHVPLFGHADNASSSSLLESSPAAT